MILCILILKVCEIARFHIYIYNNTCCMIFCILILKVCEIARFHIYIYGVWQVIDVYNTRELEHFDNDEGRATSCKYLLRFG